MYFFFFFLEQENFQVKIMCFFTFKVKDLIPSTRDQLIHQQSQIPLNSIKKNTSDLRNHNS